MSLPFPDIDLRPVDTQYAISALQRYLELMEKHMPSVQTTEMAEFDAEYPPRTDEEDHQVYADHRNYLERMFEEDLTPSMRYSFIVLMQTVLEKHLFDFCDRLHHDLKLAVHHGLIKGEGIDRAKRYLKNLASIEVKDIPEWTHLQWLKDLRNCIVHAHGYLNENREDHQRLIKSIGKEPGFSKSHESRIMLDAALPARFLSHIAAFFRKLFLKAGWKV